MTEKQALVRVPIGMLLEPLALQEIHPLAASRRYGFAVQRVGSGSVDVTARVSLLGGVAGVQAEAFFTPNTTLGPGAALEDVTCVATVAGRGLKISASGETDTKTCQRYTLETELNPHKDLKLSASYGNDLKAQRSKTWGIACQRGGTETSKGSYLARLFSAEENVQEVLLQAERRVGRGGLAGLHCTVKQRWHDEDLELDCGLRLGRSLRPEGFAEAPFGGVMLDAVGLNAGLKLSSQRWFLDLQLQLGAQVEAQGVPGPWDVLHI